MCSMVCNVAALLITLVAGTVAMLVSWAASFDTDARLLAFSLALVAGDLAWRLAFRNGGFRSARLVHRDEGGTLLWRVPLWTVGLMLAWAISFGPMHHGPNIIPPVETTAAAAS